MLKPSLATIILIWAAGTAYYFGLSHGRQEFKRLQEMRELEEMVKEAHFLYLCYTEHETACFEVIRQPPFFLGRGWTVSWVWASILREIRWNPDRNPSAMRARSRSNEMVAWGDRVQGCVRPWRSVSAVRMDGLWPEGSFLLS